MAHKFNPAKMDRLLDPQRRTWHDPDQVLKYLNLGECTILGDIGCGPGYFTLDAVQKMAPGGFVYAVDLEQAMLDRLMERARSAGLADHIRPVLAEEDDEFPIHSETCDALLLVDVYHEVDPASNTIHELRRILKPEGIMLVVDWRPEETPVGPPLDARVDPQDVVEELTTGGFVLAGTCDVGPYHYGLKFYKPVRRGDPNQTMGNVVP